MSRTEVIYEVLDVHENLKENLLTATGGKASTFKDSRAEHQVIIWPGRSQGPRASREDHGALR